MKNNDEFKPSFFFKKNLAIAETIARFFSFLVTSLPEPSIIHHHLKKPAFILRRYLLITVEIYSSLAMPLNLPVLSLELEVC
jgi:hypothetical protein